MPAPKPRNKAIFGNTLPNPNNPDLQQVAGRPVQNNPPLPNRQQGPIRLPPQHRPNRRNPIVSNPVSPQPVAPALQNPNVPPQVNPNQQQPSQVPPSPEVQPQPIFSQARLSRREILVGLAGIVAGSSLTWLAITQEPRLQGYLNKKDVTPTSGTTLLTYRGHKDVIDFIFWSPDGSSILSGSFDATFQEWKATSGEKIDQWGWKNISRNNHTAGAWSPDGKKIALGGNSSNVGIFDPTNHKDIAQYDSSDGGQTSLAWSPDGKFIAAGSYSDGITIYDTVTGKSVHYHTPSSYDVPIYAIAWSLDSKYVAAGASDNSVYIWDVYKRELHMTYRFHTAPVRMVAWSPDGKRLASGSDDGKVHIWEPNGEFTYLGHSDKVEAIAWSPDGKYIVSGSADKTAQVWDAGNGNRVFTYRIASREI